MAKSLFIFLFLFFSYNYKMEHEKVSRDFVTDGHSHSVSHD